jgi:glycerophosphoryl diester phosphodiesterase
MAAFRRAVEVGADAIELDVRLARDGTPVVIHDVTLDRTTTERGPVASRTVEELAGIRAGSTTGVPSLEQVLREIALPILLEAKEPEAQEAIAGVLLKLNAAERVVVASAHDEALDAFRQPPFLVGASARDILRLWLAPVRGVPELRCTAYSVPWRHRGVLPVPTRRFVANAHELGASVHVWTVDDPALARRLWARGVNGIITNHPARILEASAQAQPMAQPVVLGTHTPSRR